ncbi:hypothetical protein NL108_003723 [Boleophthalmus pectinirostris]|nr:hypothetical protein NL108_003723 [Boleophthalmus pectinirostris]
MVTAEYSPIEIHVEHPHNDDENINGKKTPVEVVLTKPGWHDLVPPLNFISLQRQGQESEYNRRFAKSCRLCTGQSAKNCEAMTSNSSACLGPFCGTAQQ